MSGRLIPEDPDIDREKLVWTTTLQNVLHYDVKSQRTNLLTEDGNFRPKVHPRISGNAVVWLESSGTSGNSVQDIVAYDIVTQATRILHPALPLVQGPAISGNRVVWADARNGNMDVYMYDLARNVETRLTSSPDFEGLPEITAGTIMWTKLERTDSDTQGEYTPTIQVLKLK